MKFYKDLEKRKEIVREYIRKHPQATFKEIKQNTGTKINKVYAGGLDEAYDDAGVAKPRTLKFKTPEEKKKIVIDYVRKHPTAGGQVIRRDTKINFLTLFKNTKEMFEAAGVHYPRDNYIQLIKRGADERRNKIISLLKNDPLMSLQEIGRLTNTHPHSLFKNTEEIYEAAGIPFFDKNSKRRINKQNKVILFIKENPVATQREINRACNTRVQGLFKRGIFDAYDRAGISFPFERLKMHGCAIKSINEQSRIFEERIASKLSGYGCVHRLVKTKRGVADIILERKSKKIAIEIKNYSSHEISFSQINQLNKYLEDISSNIGFLVCLKKPKKDTFLIGENRIFILLESELSKIPEITDLYFSGKIFGSSQ